MLQISRNIKHPDIAFDPVEIEVSALNSTIVLPPVNKIVYGQKLNNSIKVSTRKTANSDDATNELVKAQIKSLLKLKTRFADSSSYFSKLSALFQIIQDTKLAIEYAEAASELNSSVVYKQRLAEAYLNGDRQREALVIFRDLSAEGYVDARLRLAEFAINSQSFIEAGVIVDQAIQMDEADWRSRLVAGTLALAKGEYEQSIRHYRIAVLEKPNSSKLRLNIAISQYLLGNFKKALKDAQRAVSLYPFNRRALYFLADITLQEVNKSNVESFKKLQQYLETYSAAMPKDKRLIGRLADVYLEQNKIKDGIELLEVNKEEINSPEIFNNLGVFWSSKNQELAGKYYYKAIEILGGIQSAANDRGASFAVLNLANLLISNHSYSQAQKILEIFISSSKSNEYLEDKDLCKVPVSLVVAYINQDMVEEGLALANLYLNKPEMNILGHLDLLTMLTSYHSLVTFNHERNIAFAERALELAQSQRSVIPNYVYMMVINNLVCAYIDSGRFDEARVWADQLRVDQGHEEYVYATKGLFALHMGNFEQARSYYEKAIALAEDKDRKSAIRVKMNYELGKFLFNQKRWANAQLYLKKVIQAKDVRDGWSFKSLQSLASGILINIQQSSRLQ